MAYLGRQPNTGVRSRYIYTATASQTTFSGSDDDGKTLKYEDAAYLDVFLNGVLLKPVTDYTATTKTSVVLTSGAAASDIVEIVAYDIANIANTVSATNGGTFEADVTVQGTVTADGLTVDTDTLYVDSANNRVGVGTASPVGSGVQIRKDTASTTNELLRLTNANGSTTDGVKVTMEVANTSGNGGEIGVVRDGGSFNPYMYFSTSSGVSSAPTERARITSSGSFYIGEANAISSGDGQRINLASGSSGNYIRFKWAGSEYGSITLSGSGIALNSANALVLDGNPSIKLGINGSTRIIMDSDEFYPNGDNFMTLGWSGGRYVQLYAVSGSINTSDANEKQDVAELDEAEKRVATAAKGLIRKFRWIDAVEAKGDDARIHVGIIAQDLKAAFEAEGLDAHRYGMFCSDTWWEADEVIPAVEEIVDEEGNVITEAQPERTETRTYRVAEEAPEGAVERTRLGVRYSELLAFIIGAM